MEMVQTKYNSPIGPLYIVTNGDALRILSFTEMQYPYGQSMIAEEVIRQLEEYFKGERRTFDVKLEVSGTEFQKRCWAALQTIGYGEQISYKEEARRIGNIKAMRAVGQANNRNPIAIIIPCHRVISANGDIGGYAGGVEIKKRLLSIELGSLEK
ncbi:MAG: methylated-DNA--[protein]-cysteine S-methyltransferase [Bacteroidales bacterium]|nr:methylated-DNA--[protein]-cysteine S-methyltransferase [Bacteroidales bacterium]